MRFFDVQTISQKEADRIIPKKPTAILFHIKMLLMPKTPAFY